MTKTGNNQGYAIEVGNQEPPKSWLYESILVTLFLFLPLGIVAMIYAIKSESRFYAGDIERSYRAAELAKKWTMIGFWVGAICIFATIFIYGF